MTDAKKMNAMLVRNGRTEVLSEQDVTDLMNKILAKNPRQKNVYSHQVYLEFVGSAPSSKESYIKKLSSKIPGKRGRKSKITIESEKTPESTVKVDNRGMFSMKVFNKDKTRNLSFGSYECLLLNKVWFDKKGIKTEIIMS